MKINHRPIFDIAVVEKHYSEKDGVPIRYVCTSSANMGTVAYDIFYRETPHPEFGNHYFGLFMKPDYTGEKSTLMITNADSIEDLDFDMVLVNNEWHYSQHRWDYYQVSNELAIDGGRAYLKMVGNFKDAVTARFHVKDGEFVKEELDD